MSRVREKVGLLRLLSGLAFLCFDLLKQVNIAVEGKWKKNSVTGLELFAQTAVFFIPFFVTTPYLARARVCRRFVFYPFPRDAAQGAGHSLIWGIALQWYLHIKAS